MAMTKQEMIEQLQSDNRRLGERVKQIALEKEELNEELDKIESGAKDSKRNADEAQTYSRQVHQNKETILEILSTKTSAEARIEILEGIFEQEIQDRKDPHRIQRNRYHPPFPI